MSKDTVVIAEAEDPESMSYSREMPFHVRVSVATEQGNIRETMEDRVVVGSFVAEPYTYEYFVVLDGHGGTDVVDYAHERFGTLLEFNVKAREGKKQKQVSTRDALKNTFLDLDGRVNAMTAGSTLSLLLLMFPHDSKHKKQTWVANVGDSSIVGVTPREVVRRVTLNHNLELKQERQRINKNPEAYTQEGYVGKTDTPYLLAVTRAIGDIHFGDLVPSVPTIKQLKSKFTHFILASDGVWDVVDGKTAWQHVKSPVPWQDAARVFADWRNSHFDQHDNVAVIVVSGL